MMPRVSRRRSPTIQRGKGSVLAARLEKFDQPDFQAFRERFERFQRWVASSVLDVTEGCLLKSGTSGEFVLRPPFLTSQSPNRARKCLRNLSIARREARFES
jgi:hypothetical protein